MIILSLTISSIFCLQAETIEVETEQVLNNLLEDEDTDNDKKITVDDFFIENSKRGDRNFELKTIDNKIYNIAGTYYLSNLLQELTLKKELKEKKATILLERIFEEPVQRISRMIREYYWSGLTRKIDTKNLMEVLEDSKIPSSTTKYLYVSYHDKFGYDYFSNYAKELKDITLHVIRLPEHINATTFKELEGKHGLLPLALEKNEFGEIQGIPFVVPGGRFNEMYGWDSYFESLGLIADKKVLLAKAMVDNFVYEIENYGKILNANRSYYLNRSQPPFLTSMALAVYNELPKTEISKQWLKKVLFAAIKEYRDVWMNKDRLTDIGLNRYYGMKGAGIPPEVEPGHFDIVLTPYAEKHKLSLTEFEKKYKAGEIQESELDIFFLHDCAVRESGHDTTYRWRIDGKDSCADFVTVDLNSILYKYELDIAFMIKEIFCDDIENESSEIWYAQAEKRKSLILKYLWNPEKNMFFDYHIPHATQSDYISATMFYPLWACHSDNPKTKILNEEQAKKLLYYALPYLESNGGILSSAKISLEKYGIKGAERQWDYPNGWAPHQMLIWKGLYNYNIIEIADRLIYKWLYTITKNAVDYNGTIPEKFDVVKQSHAVFAEYGNVGTKFSYMTKEGFGWMNASYQVGLSYLSEKWKNDLKNLTPPEKVNF